jgi:hypothetical protein
MSQHDMSIDNAAGATVRTDINNALQALASLSGGASAPATTYAGMLWADSTNNVLKQRNQANSAWIILGTLDSTRVLSKTAAYTCAVADTGKRINADSSGGTFAIAFPAAATAGDGWNILIQHAAGSASITLTGANGGSDQTLTAGQAAVVSSNGTALSVLVVPAASASATGGSYNYSGTLSASVASNALTVSASGGTVTFRSSTVTSGAQNTRSVSSPSITLSAGSTLGFTASEAGRIYIYALDNAGTVELALCRVGNLDESALHSTTAEGSAGGADSASTLYSTTARTSVPVRLIGIIEITTGSTAGNWSSAPTKLSLYGPGVHRTGDIVQTVTATKTDTFSWTGTAWTDITGLSLSITPKSAANKIDLEFSIGTLAAVNQTVFRFDRNGTTIGVGDAAGTRLRGTVSQAGVLNADHSESCGGRYQDSPASTSALTYKLQGSHQYAYGGIGYINRSTNDTDTTHQGYARTISSITATEICA